MSGLFSCPNQKASFQLEVNHFAAMIMVATSMPKEIINDNTLNVLILITANLRVDQQRLDPFRGLKFNIVLSIIKVNRLEVPNSHLGDQQEPFSFCNYFNQYLFICRNIFQNSSYSKKSLIYRSEFWVLQIYFNKFLLYNEIIMSCTWYDLFYCSQFSY